MRLYQIFSAGKGRNTILSLGVVILILTGLGLFLTFLSYAERVWFFLHIVIEVALLIDGSGRIYFGIRNKMTSRWSRILGIVTGIIEIILASYLRLGHNSMF